VRPLVFRSVRIPLSSSPAASVHSSSPRAPRALSSKAKRLCHEQYAVAGRAPLQVLRRTHAVRQPATAPRWGLGALNARLTVCLVLSKAFGQADARRSFELLHAVLEIPLLPAILPAHQADAVIVRGLVVARGTRRDNPRTHTFANERARFNRAFPEESIGKTRRRLSPWRRGGMR
jgi:hypothetical protein